MRHRFKIGDKIIYCPTKDSEADRAYLAVSGTKAIVLDVVSDFIIQIGLLNNKFPVPYNPFTCNPNNCKLERTGQLLFDFMYE